jgi:hypothetical protein
MSDGCGRPGNNVAAVLTGAAPNKLKSSAFDKVSRVGFDGTTVDSVLPKLLFVGTALAVASVIPEPLSPVSFTRAVAGRTIFWEVVVAAAAAATGVVLNDSLSGFVGKGSGVVPSEDKVEAEVCIVSAR